MFSSFTLSSFKNSARYVLSTNDLARHASKAAIAALLFLAAREVGMTNVNPFYMAAGTFIGFRLSDSRSPEIRCGITYSCH